MILVTGSSGYVGSRTLARLAGRGLPVAGLVRNPERARTPRPIGVPHRVADYDDPTALRRALDGIATLVFVASDGAGLDVMRHHANVLRAAADAGVGRIVFTSITDLEPSSPFYFTPVYRDAEALACAAASDEHRGKSYRLTGGAAHDFHALRLDRRRALRRGVGRY